MRTITYKLADLGKAVIHLGKANENEATRVQIDAGVLFAEYQTAVPTLKVINPAGTVYSAEVTRDGDYVLWDIKDSDLTENGSGEFQLTFTENGVVVKSAISRTQICPSITGGGTAPDPVQDWLDHAEEVLEEVEDAFPEGGTTGQVLAKKSDADFDTEWVDQGAGGTTDYTDLENKPQIGGVTLTGNVSLHDIGAAAEADIPDPTSIIDDTAGDGDTNKVWSADKTDAELADVKRAIQQKISEPESEGTDGQMLTTDGHGGRTWTTPAGGGGTVDSSLSGSSTNPVQNKVITGFLNDITTPVQSKNLYNQTASNPQNGKWYNLTDGTVEDSANYAITGKIPVEASTQYIFHNNGLAKVKRVHYFKGDSGQTYISKETLDNAAFTTPAQCTFIGISLFAASHTADAYTAAMAVAMLEKGAVASDYVPYSVTNKVPTNRLVDGVAVEGAKNYTVEKSLINLFDKTKAKDNTVFNQSTSEVGDNTSYAFSGLIPVEPNMSYCYSIDETLQKGTLPSKYQEWSSAKEFIQQSQGEEANIFINQIRTGSTTRYISFNIVFNSHTATEYSNLIDTLMVVEGTQRPLAYSAYNIEPVVNHLKLDTAYHDNADRFKGKRWLAFGTSVTYQDSKQYTEGVAVNEIVRGYVGNVARRKPMIVVNSGISGSTLGDYDSYSLINRYTDFTYTDYDFVTIEYGINDFGHDIPVGSASDAAGTTSFAACLKTIIEHILSENPIIGLIICTDPDVRGTTQNNNNNTLKEYADVALAIAEQYRLPVCDWFYHSGINSITKGDGTSRYFLTQSGTHPSVYGHMRMGAMLNQVFDSLLC